MTFFRISHLDEFRMAFKSARAQPSSFVGERVSKHYL